HVILLVAARAEAVREIGNAVVAGPSVYCARAFGQRCNRLFPDTHRARCGSRHSGDCLGRLDKHLIILYKNKPAGTALAWLAPLDCANGCAVAFAGTL